MPMRNGKVRIIQSPGELREVFGSVLESRSSTRKLAPPVDALSRKLRSWSPRSSENIFTLEVEDDRVRNTVARKLGETLISGGIKILLPSTDSATAVDLERVSDPEFKAVLFVSFGFSTKSTDQSDVDSGPLNTLWLKQTEKQSIPFPAVIFVKHEKAVEIKSGLINETSLAAHTAVFLMMILALTDLTFYLQLMGAYFLVHSTWFDWIFAIYNGSLLTSAANSFYYSTTSALNFLALLPGLVVLYWILEKRRNNQMGRLKIAAPLFLTIGLVLFFVLFYYTESGMAGPNFVISVPLLQFQLGFLSSLFAIFLLCMSMAISTSSLMSPRTRVLYLILIALETGSLIVLSAGTYMYYNWLIRRLIPDYLPLPPAAYNQINLNLIGISLVSSVILEFLLIVVWFASTIPRFKNKQRTRSQKI